MKKKTSTQTKNRMIHIRLDEKTHKRLKIVAVQKDTTIQKLVEDLILQNLMNLRSRTIS